MKRHFRDVRARSAWPPLTTITRTLRFRRSVPIASLWPHVQPTAQCEMDLQKEPDLQKKRMLETMLEIARETPRRQASFVERIGDLYQCPCCWLRYERHTNLIPLGGVTEDFGPAGLKHFERFRCDACY